jgi:hypothetical protein
MWYAPTSHLMLNLLTVPHFDFFHCCAFLASILDTNTVFVDG